MRIDAYAQIQQIYNTNKATGAQKATGATKTAKPSFRDAVQISSQGKDFQFAKQAVGAAPDVRTEMTDPIKNSMQAGTYHVSDSDFADKLLEKYSALLAQ